MFNVFCSCSCQGLQVPLVSLYLSPLLSLGFHKNASLDSVCPPFTKQQDPENMPIHVALSPTGLETYLESQSRGNWVSCSPNSNLKIIVPTSQLS